MTDREFLRAFESLTFPPEQFHHRQHVRLAWIYLHELPLIDALTRFVESLKRFAAHVGSAGVYHETITFAFLFLIHERMQQTPAHARARQGTSSFEEFAETNADLFTWKPSILDRYYRAETLQSELARRTFVMPDAGGQSRPMSAA